MVLCQKAKFDQKNRVLIPKDMMKEAGGYDNCEVYVTCEEGTNKVILIFKKVENKEEQKCLEKPH